MGPNINSFANKIVKLATLTPESSSSSVLKTKQTTNVQLNIKSLNNCIRKSSKKMAHLIRIMGDYFKIFNGALKKVLNEVKSSKLNQSYLSLNL